MRIDKLLSQLKYCSRSESKAFLNKHEVCVDEKRILIPSQVVFPVKQKITIDHEPIFYREDIHLMINKPKGFISANHDPWHPCVVDLIQEPYSRYDMSIAGRLDIDAEGLLILSTSGTLVHEITSPRHHLPKVYEVILDQPFTHFEALLNGVEIRDGKNQLFLAKALDIINVDGTIHITIDEGKFHQVKRMFQAVGYLVTHLKRIQIGHLKLGDLAEGSYREFDKEELYD